MHNRQDKIWMLSTPSGEEMGKSFREHLQQKQLIEEALMPQIDPLNVWQQKQFEQLAVQRVTYTFYDYIKVINSYRYKELCIFKPHGVIHYAIKAIKKEQWMMQKIDPILMWYKLREPNITKFPYMEMDSFPEFTSKTPKHAKYILNHTQRHPFYVRNHQNEKQVTNAIYNYEVAQRIKTGNEDKIRSLLRAYMFNGSVKLSTLNQSRLKLLGIDLTYTGMDLGISGSAVKRQQQKSQQFMQRYGNPISHKPNP